MTALRRTLNLHFIAIFMLLFFSLSLTMLAARLSGQALIESQSKTISGSIAFFDGSRQRFHVSATDSHGRALSVVLKYDSQTRCDNNLGLGESIVVRYRSVRAENIAISVEFFDEAKHVNNAARGRCFGMNGSSLPPTGPSGSRETQRSRPLPGELIVLNDDLKVPMESGSSCNMSDGDSLYVYQVGTNHQEASAVVVSSKGGTECAPATRVEIRVRDVNRMHDAMQSSLSPDRLEAACKNVYRGESSEEVRRTLGEPYSIQRHGPKAIFNYEPCIITLDEDRVIEID